MQKIPPISMGIPGNKVDPCPELRSRDGFVPCFFEYLCLLLLIKFFVCITKKSLRTLDFRWPNSRTVHLSYFGNPGEHRSGQGRPQGARLADDCFLPPASAYWELFKGSRKACKPEKVPIGGSLPARIWAKSDKTNKSIQH